MRPLALITGASAGMGAAFAECLAQRGYDVALVARRLDRLVALSQRLSDTYNIGALHIAADLSLPDAHIPIMAALEGRPVAILVNNAGLSIAGHFSDEDWTVQRNCLMTLTVAVAGLTHAVLPDMIKAQKGRIITISSLLALSQGGPGHTLYPAAKSFAHKFMLSLAGEVGRQGIVCTSVLPGTTSSDFAAANNIAMPEKGLARLFSNTPEQVAQRSLEANFDGKLIAIIGWHNKLAAFMMKILPDWLIRWVGRKLV